MRSTTHLAQAGHNRVLADLMKTLRDRSAPLFRGFGLDFARASWAEHAGILRAVIAGDAETGLAAGLSPRHQRRFAAVAATRRDVAA